MGFWEVLGIIAAALVALNSALDALRGVTLAPVRIFRWLRRAVHAVDVVVAIPGRLDRTEQLLADHLEQVKPQVQLLNQMASDLGVVVHEVRHNGGSSMKDAIARVETGVKGLYTPTGPTPTVRTRRRSKPQESA